MQAYLFSAKLFKQADLEPRPLKVVSFIVYGENRSAINLRAQQLTKELCNSNADRFVRKTQDSPVVIQPHILSDLGSEPLDWASFPKGERDESKLARDCVFLSHSDLDGLSPREVEKIMSSVVRPRKSNSKTVEDYFFLASLYDKGLCARVEPAFLVRAPSLKHAAAVYAANIVSKGEMEVLVEHCCGVYCSV